MTDDESDDDDDDVSMFRLSPGRCRIRQSEQPQRSDMILINKENKEKVVVNDGQSII